MRLTRAAACRSLVGCLVALSLTSPVLAQPRPATVLELAARQKNLTTFIAAVHTAGLDDTLKSAGPYTVYAPSDEAFAKMPAADRAALFASPERLRTVLLGHVVKDMVVMRDGDSAITSGAVSTAAGRDLAFTVDDHDRQLVAGAHLVAWDLRADNGCVNVIDKVLLP
ncbi:MAG: hypothetical protein QOJ39_2570 [Candidatus Eremiobacteraeota bacterium]|jgi:uncharacterized surface protein with fasciclin (FAS1) repeats|nr:hypothetical protein [Candidatus Eremiobacteraeota bacterium]